MSKPPKMSEIKGIWYSKKGELLIKYIVLNIACIELEKINYYKHINDVLGAIAENKIWRKK
jgi:hypothetical protein